MVEVVEMEVVVGVVEEFTMEGVSGPGAMLVVPEDVDSELGRAVVSEPSVGLVSREDPWVVLVAAVIPTMTQNKNKP